MVQTGQFCPREDAIVTCMNINVSANELTIGHDDYASAGTYIVLLNQHTKDLY